MTPIADLIAHFEQHAKDCEWEIDQLVGRFNARAVAGELGSMTEADLRRMTGEWEGSRRIARDTVSWLRTLQSRMTG
jgi:hypothetical protein